MHRLLPAPKNSRRPNVLIFVTDDQTIDTVHRWTMPNTYRWFVTEGRSYPNFFVVDPLCCPSRAAIMTGRYDHNLHVIGNTRNDFRALKALQPWTLQCRLRKVGYRTGLFGKYFNGWDYHQRPRCLDGYAIFPGDKHLSTQFFLRHRRFFPKRYADHYIGKESLKFLSHADRRGRRGRHRPWYLYVATSVPHSPYTAEAKYRHLPEPRLLANDADRETNVADKPPAMQAHQDAPHFQSHKYRAQLRMLRTADDLVGSIYEKLRRDDQLDNTLAIFVSDNGYLFGEHHLTGKRLEYTPSIEVPFYLSWPLRVQAHSVDRRPSLNVDIAPTVLAAARQRSHGRFLDGRDLFAKSWHRPLVFNEQFHDQPDDPKQWQPTWFSLRSRTWQYVEIYSAQDEVTFREYYDLAEDPDQLENLLAPGADAPQAPSAQTLARLHRLILRYRHCRARGCP